MAETVSNFGKCLEKMSLEEAVYIYMIQVIPKTV